MCDFNLRSQRHWDGQSCIQHECRVRLELLQQQIFIKCVHSSFFPKGVATEFYTVKSKMPKTEWRHFARWMIHQPNHIVSVIKVQKVDFRAMWPIACSLTQIPDILVTYMYVRLSLPFPSYDNSATDDFEHIF